MNNLLPLWTLLAQNEFADAEEGSPVTMVVFLLVIVAIIAGIWKVFTKAGKPGWACLIPIYNVIVLLEIAGKPTWWVILYLIPIVGLVIAIIVAIDVGKAFGKDTGYGLGLAFLPFIFYPLLGFGDAQYQGAPS